MLYRRDSQNTTAVSPPPRTKRDTKSTSHISIFYKRSILGNNADSSINAYNRWKDYITYSPPNPFHYFFSRRPQGVRKPEGRHSQWDSPQVPLPPTRSDALVLSYNCPTIQFGVYDGWSRRLCQNMWRFFAADEWRFNFWRPWCSLFFGSSSAVTFSFMTIILIFC